MVKKQNSDDVQDDIEITNDTTNTDMNDPELVDIENAEENKLKVLRTKLKDADEKYRDLLEELQRTKADFLNGKRRLEEERVRDRERTAIAHVEKLLPLCDSFYLAMRDETQLETLDPKWRQGIEGTYSLLKGLITSYNITSYDPTGELFDPNRHEALSMITVDNAAQDNFVISVIQQGYEQKCGDIMEIIRPARVTVGEYKRT